MRQIDGPHMAHMEAHIDVRMLKAPWLLGCSLKRTSSAHTQHALAHIARTAPHYRVRAVRALFGAEKEG